MASQAFDVSSPKDFEFLFHQAPQEGADKPLQQQPLQQTVNEVAPRASSLLESAPDKIDGEGVLWIRTPIRRASDLVDGQAWIQDFQRRLQELAQKGVSGRDVGSGSSNGRVTSSMRLAEGRVLREMAKVC